MVELITGCLSSELSYF